MKCEKRNFDVPVVAELTGHFSYPERKCVGVCEKRGMVSSIFAVFSIFSPHKNLCFCRRAALQFVFVALSSTAAHSGPHCCSADLLYQFCDVTIHVILDNCFFLSILFFLIIFRLKAVTAWNMTFTIIKKCGKQAQREDAFCSKQDSVYCILQTTLATLAMCKQNCNQNRLIKLLAYLTQL